MAGNKALNNHTFYDNATTTNETDTSTLTIIGDESSMMLEFVSDDVVSAKVYGDIFGKGGLDFIYTNCWCCKRYCSYNYRYIYFSNVSSNR